MILRKKVKWIVLGFIILCVFSLIFTQTRQLIAHADSNENSNSVISEEYSYQDDNVEPAGIFTSLSISINGGNGKIWTTVRNDVTIFPATVTVIVELYSSDTYYESYQNMTLQSINSTTDLNVWQTISAEASTGGVQKYWQGRMRYKIDKGSWQQKNTGTLLYDSEGNYIGIL